MFVAPQELTESTVDFNLPLGLRHHTEIGPNLPLPAVIANYIELDLGVPEDARAFAAEFSGSWALGNIVVHHPDIDDGAVLCPKVSDYLHAQYGINPAETEKHFSSHADFLRLSQARREHAPWISKRSANSRK